MKMSEQRLIQLEFYCLCLLAFSLPILETLKHLFSLAYLIVFCTRYCCYRDTFQHSPVGKYIIIFVLLSIIAAIGSTLNGFSNDKLHDIIRYSLIGWMALHTPLSRRQLSIIITILIISTLLGAAEAYWLMDSGTKIRFELRSVGHVNHSSIYILLILGAALPLTLAYSNKKVLLAIIILVTFTLLYVLLETNSRATAIGIITLAIPFLLVVFIHCQKIGYVFLVVIALTTLYCIFSPPNVIKKFIGQNNYYTNKLTPREKVWHTAYYVWKAQPTFGVGYGNYKVVTLEKMKEWHPNSTRDFSNIKQFLFLTHTHNRYINTLAEGGLTGLLGLIALLFGYAKCFISTFKHSIQDKRNIAVWLIGTNALVSTIVVGLFNTSLHHEHGILTMLLLGLSVQLLQKNTSNST